MKRIVVLLAMASAGAFAAGGYTLALVGANSLAAPAVLTVKDNARLLCLPGCEKLSEFTLGYHTTGGDNWGGILKVQDNAIVSNNVSVGCYGKGACYLFGAVRGTQVIVR